MISTSLISTIESHHPKMNDEVWEKTYKICWYKFYTYEHLHRILLRKLSIKLVKQKLFFLDSLVQFRDFMGLHCIHPTVAGVLRYKKRFDRRKNFPIEGPITFLFDIFLITFTL